MARPGAVPTTALVIDDEVPVRQLVHRMLEPEVCRVLEAPDAETGLRIIEVDDPSVDIVLTDWIMPGLDGLDVIEVLRQYRPGLPVAVISGYTATLHPVVGDGNRYRMLQKPFTAEQIQQMVSEMVASARRLRESARELADWATRPAMRTQQSGRRMRRCGRKWTWYRQPGRYITLERGGVRLPRMAFRKVPLSR